MDDCISRQAAIDKINERQRKLIYCFGFENDMVKIMDIAKSIIIAMPSAEPERKKGEWKKSYADHEAFGMRPFFRYCSECHEATVYPYNFCPNCGADMRGEGNDG